MSNDIIFINPSSLAKFHFHHEVSGIETKANNDGTLTFTITSQIGMTDTKVWLDSCDSSDAQAVTVVNGLVGESD